jgi:hypothetical protein
MESKELSVTVGEFYDETVSIRSLIYYVRNQPVMLDSDLAKLYQVETKVLNQAVSRNKARFPESFRFKLTKKEFDSLRSQIVTSNVGIENGGRGGRRYLPHVFNEPGIAMLSSVLRSDIAISVSIRIMESFVEMRRYMASTSLMHERLNSVEARQISYQKETDERFEKVFDYIASREESEQKVFFDGQIYDAFSLIASLIEKANTTLVLIDNYVDTHTLDLLSKKKKNVAATIYTLNNGSLTASDITTFNSQYPSLHIKYSK